MSDEKIESIAAPSSQSTDDPKESKIKELESKLGEMGKTIGEQEEFIRQANTVVNTVAFNPELKEKFKQVYNSINGVPSEQQEEKPGEKKETTDVSEQVKRVSEKVDETSMSQRERVIADFENKYSMTKMSPEEQKDFRGKIGGYFSDFGLDIRSVPLTKLPVLLDRAYVGTHAEKLREEGRLEGFTKARGDAYGMMPSMSSSSISEPETGRLSSKQADWAKKLGVDPEKAAKRYKETIKTEE